MKLSLGIVSVRPFVPSCVRRRAAQVAAEHWDSLAASKEWGDFQREQPIIADILAGQLQGQVAPCREREARDRVVPVLTASNATSRNNI